MRNSDYIAFHSQGELAALESQGRVAKLFSDDLQAKLMHLQYFMFNDYLHTFVAQNPPEWYGSLAVLYLAQALAQDKTDTVTKLNARRTQALFTEKISTACVYQDQGARFYLYEWGEMFPQMNKFLQEQRDNAVSYQPEIEKMTTLWIAEISGGLDQTTDLNEKK